MRPVGHGSYHFFSAGCPLSLGEDLNPYLARAIFVGTIEHTIIRWLLKDMSYSLFDTLEHTFELLLSGVQRPSSL